MYERFYQLRERPFALSPDPDYLYPSRVHREALDYLRFGIEGDAGFVVITGEIGSGKTTLLQVLLRSLDGQTTVVRLVNTLLTGRELLESLLIDLGVTDPPLTKPLMLRELARLLVEQRAAGRRVVAVIDEAQNLPLDALEELRMLSNMETEKSKLIQIVLVGQPDLRDTLEQSSLEQLRQRVTVRYHLDRLDEHETEQYINHRLKRAATAAPLTFPRDVTNAIHARSFGVPRMINVICDAVLLCGYAEESRVIDQQLVRMAIEELEASAVLRSSTNAGGRAQAAPPVPVAAAEPARPPVAAPAVSAPAASLAVPASPASPAVPASTAVPWTRATLAEMQLRPLAQSPAPLTNRPLREPERAPSPAAPAKAFPSRQPMTRTGYAPTANTPRTVAQVRPAAPRQAAFNVEPARPGGALSWLKDVLFGSGPAAERR